MTEKAYVRVRDVMTRDVKTIDGLSTVREAIELMRRENVSSLVIARRHEGDEFGIVVIDDIATKVIGPDCSPDRTNVYEVMSKPVLTVDGDMDIKYAIRLLARFNLSRALVIEGNEPAGIVTLRDMVLRYVPPAQQSAAAES